jgi:hypothetical protein
MLCLSIAFLKLIDIGILPTRAISDTNVSCVCDFFKDVSL